MPSHVAVMVQEKGFLTSLFLFLSQSRGQGDYEKQEES